MAQFNFSGKFRLSIQITQIALKRFTNARLEPQNRFVAIELNKHELHSLVNQPQKQNPTILKLLSSVCY